MLLSLHVTCSCIFHAYVPSFMYILILNCAGAFCLSPSLSFFRLVALWHLNENLLHPRTFFVPRHLLLILPPPTSGFVMIKSVRTFRRIFLDEAFIQNATSSYWISPILNFPLSFTVGARSHSVVSWSLVLPWSYKSSTPTCTDSIIQCLISSLVFEVRVLWLLQILYLRCSTSWG